MKNRILPCLAALTGLLAAEPSLVQAPIDLNLAPISNPEPNAPARLAVTVEIVSRLQPQMPPFSRAMVVRPYPNFRAVELVDGEQRLPFTVSMLGKRDEVIGYVRISDNAIFIFRPEKKDHIRSTPETLHARLQAAEHRLYPAMIAKYATRLRP
jgi:hypothetical protein